MQWILTSPAVTRLVSKKIRVTLPLAPHAVKVWLWYATFATPHIQNSLTSNPYDSTASYALTC